jgi:hypothetical protein
MSEGKTAARQLRRAYRQVKRADKRMQRAESREICGYCGYLRYQHDARTVNAVPNSPRRWRLKRLDHFFDESPDYWNDGWSIVATAATAEGTGLYPGHSQ